MVRAWRGRVRAERLLNCAGSFSFVFTNGFIFSEREIVISVSLSFIFVGGGMYGQHTFIGKESFGY